MTGIEFLGFHLYDGQNHQDEPELRREAIREIWEWRNGIVDLLQQRGLTCETTIAGGTPTFPFFAEIADCSLSPGTAFLHDAGYASHFPDLPFRPAAWVLGRIVSRHSDGAFTIDVGSKAIATDQNGPRGWFPDLIDPELGEQSEEHWVLREPSAPDRQIGEIVRVVPTHICPTVNLYNEIIVLRRKSRIFESWPVDARDRALRSNATP
jgi:D-serine deaminase-like pyridoxal phosphate-dependent protein